MAEPSADGLVLSGSAHQVYPALGADSVVVAARRDAELGLVAVATDRTGLEIEPESRTDGTASGTLHFREIAAAAGAGGGIFGRQDFDGSEIEMTAKV